MLRATLRERGYDAIGTRSVAGALRIPTQAADRGAVEVLVVDQEALSDEEKESDGSMTRELLDRYPAAATVLLERVSVRTPDVRHRWTRTLQRPVSVEAIAVVVERLRPLPAEDRIPLD
jgi:hypothetical protein